ncbi:MAG: ATP-binding protein [Pseudomonadota bacterium]
MNAQSPEFLARLVHDLRAPTRALLDLPDWLKDDFEDASVAMTAESSKLLTLMRENAHQLDHLVSGLARLSRAAHEPQEGREFLQPAPLISALPAMRRVSASLSCDEEQICMAKADLAEIVGEAVANAVRFHPHTTPRMAIEGARQDAVWQLRFLDDGLGPDPRICPTATHPFARAAVGETAPGSGLGLAALAAIAQRYGGEVALTPRRDGTTGAELSLRLRVL